MNYGINNITKGIQNLEGKIEIFQMRGHANIFDRTYIYDGGEEQSPWDDQDKIIIYDGGEEN